MNDRLTHRAFRVPSLAAALATALAVPACDQPAPTGLLEPSPPLARVAAGHAGHGDPLPMRAHAGAFLLAQTFAPDFGPPLFGRSDFDGRCSLASDFVISFGLEGQATHLGRFEATFEHCSQLDPATGRSTVIDGLAAFTAANGDELWARYADQPAAGGGNEEVMTFTGGTGRFASASGGGIGHAECDRQAGTCVYAFEGVISYDASGAR